ncbi:MAG: shikimate dehydrogenase [Dehalococcoidia bacterium]|nr:shikimate dehydrogenase [Dehalococcoidia bacterium]
MTKRAGVIGHPLTHTKSPAIFDAAFRAAGIDATYEAWDAAPDVLEGRIEALRGSDFLGANITIPHKQAVLPLIDGAVGDASKIAAVNTIVHDGGKLVGHNTDVAGFRRALHDDVGFEAHGRRTMILGSGGAARAVALALVEAKASVIYVVGRQPKRVESLVLQLKLSTPTGTTISWAYWGDGSYERSLRESDLIVHCTPIGLAGSGTEGQSPVDVSLIGETATVFDLVYNPEETALVAGARDRGIKASGGLGMLVYQAAESFRLWTGQGADIGAMIAAAR